MGHERARTRAVGWAAGLLAAALSFTGCDAVFSFSGAVRDTAGRPIAAAKARVKCDRELIALGTDETGRFSQRGRGLVPNDCYVEVSAPGYESWRRPVVQLCTHQGTIFGRGCHDVLVDVVLPREEPSAKPSLTSVGSSAAASP